MKHASRQVHSFALALTILVLVFAGVLLVEGVVWGVQKSGFVRFFEVADIPAAQATPYAQEGTPNIAADKPALPLHFEEEVFSVAAYRDVRVSDAADVVGCLAPGDASACFLACAEKLSAKGWVPVESGQAQAASFFKEGGHYTRLYLSCTAVSDEVAVVVQCAPCDP
ncbi:MAG: hypothetical protein RR572_05455 [Raoultibacter sp.]